MLRPAATTVILRRLREHVDSTITAFANFARPQSFSVPADASAAAVRATRNLSYFCLHYGVVQWAVLLLVLAPSQPATVVLLMAESKVLVAYLALLGAFPDSAVLRCVDRRVLVGVVAFVVVVQVVLVRAVGCLLMALGLAAPMVLCHAVFRSRDEVTSCSDGVHEDGKTNAAAAKQVLGHVNAV